MKIEIKSAAQFLVDLVRLNANAESPLTDDQLERFKSNVTDILLRHYTNHWFPEKPFKGSGYRCIRINGKMDPLIARAGFMMGLAVSFLRSLFPSELTMWVDPREVSYRIGENGSICILYEGAEKTIVKGEEAMPPATAPTEPKQQSNGMKTPEKSPSPSMVVVQSSPVVGSPANVAAAVVTQQSPSPPPALPHHHQPPPQQQQVHHHHQQHHHHHHHHPHHHPHQQQHHFSPSKSVVVSSPLQLSRPMSPVSSQLSQQQNQQQAAAAAMQLSMFLMNKDSGLIKCKESLQRGLEVARPLQMMDRLFVSS